MDSFIYFMTKKPILLFRTGSDWESLFTGNFLTDEGILSRKEGRRMGDEGRGKSY